MATKLRKRQCPTCKHTLDAATPIDGGEAKPRKGDLTICINCAEILEYQENLRLRRLTPECLKKLPEETYTDLLTARHIIKENIEVFNK